MFSGTFSRPEARLVQVGYLFEQDCPKGRLQGAFTLTFGSLFGAILVPGEHLGVFWGSRT